MTRLHLTAIFFLLCLVCLAILLLTGFGSEGVFWAQWGRNGQHAGMVGVPGQPLNRKLADIVYDPFVPDEKAENLPVYGVGVLTVHYESTLIDNKDTFYMVQKSGTYPSCSPRGVESTRMECGPIRLETRRGSASLDLLDGLETGTECCQLLPGLRRFARLGASIPSGAGWPAFVCSGRRRHGVEGQQTLRPDRIAYQSIRGYEHRSRKHIRFRPADRR
jgi:hypothetical protein